MPEFKCEPCGARLVGSHDQIGNIANSHVCPAPPEVHMRTTAAGTHVYTDSHKGRTLVFAEHPDQPIEFRHQHIGDVEAGGFAPTPYLNANHGPDVLRAIADLIEEIS